MTKSFLSQNQQVDLLIARGLSINDREIAIQKLQSINYYRFNAYFHQFLKNDIFIPGTTFDNILSAYEKDRKLRHTILEHLEAIEVKTRWFQSTPFSLTGMESYFKMWKCIMMVNGGRYK